MIWIGAHAKGSFGDGRQIFAGVIPIDDPYGMGEVSLDQFPDPDGAITDY
jgi:hypothetical protein